MNDLISRNKKWAFRWFICYACASFATSVFPLLTGMWWQWFGICAGAAIIGVTIGFWNEIGGGKRK